MNEYAFCAIIPHPQRLTQHPRRRSPEDPFELAALLIPNEMVLESQLAHTIVNLVFAIAN